MGKKRKRDDDYKEGRRGRRTWEREIVMRRKETLLTVMFKQKITLKEIMAGRPCVCRWC